MSESLETKNKPLEIKAVNSVSVKCDGGNGAFGHPAVYLHIDKEDGFIDCPYCSLRFQLS